MSTIRSLPALSDRHHAVPRKTSDGATAFSAKSRSRPVWTLMVMGIAVALAFAPGWNSELIYDRSAILSGQFWRLWTGPWIHFSPRHLICDLIPLGVAGWIVETRGWPLFPWFCVLAPCVISVATLVFEPDLQWCCGLSGTACAIVAVMALDGLSDESSWRFFCAAALVGLAAEILFRKMAGHRLFAVVEGVPVLVSSTSHIAGAVTGLTVGIWRNFCDVVHPEGVEPSTF